MNSIQTVVRVGISDLNVVVAPDTIRTSGLGSCVGAVVYDLQNKVAGLAHVMLPDSSLTKQENINKYKYADTSIPILIEKLTAKGARRYALKAKLAGGAQMFQFASNSEIMRIGPRNTEAVKLVLAQFKIPIVSSDVGGSWGRTIEFDPKTGDLKVRSVKSGETII